MGLVRIDMETQPWAAWLAVWVVAVCASLVYHGLGYK